MCGFHRFSVFLTTWLCVLLGTQVESHYDAIDPIGFGLEEWNERQARVANRDGRQPRLDCERPNIYICEEPPNVIPAESTKTCNYRNVRYHEQVYRWVAGRGCLYYLQSWLYKTGNHSIPLNAACYYEGMMAPCLEIAKPDGTCGCFPFDPAIEEVANEVREAIVPAAHGRWERCFYTAEDCCSHTMPDNYTDGNDHCEATFDAWTCWPEAELDTIATEVCPEFAYTNTPPSCHHYSYKPCYQNGTWEVRTNYATCSISPRLLRRYRFHIAMLSFSIVSCVPAVFIFFFYKRLRVTRVALHRNLMIAIIVKNVLVIVSRSEIYIDELTNAGETVMFTNGVACRVLAVAERIATNAVFVAMLIEGIFLHRLIVAVFKKKLKISWLYAIGAMIVIFPGVAWATVMLLKNNHSCWLIYTVDNIQWILDGPRVLILLINTVLFIDVVRVLLTKIRNSENAYQLSTAKATLFLMPIFGIQFLLTAFRPSTTDCTGEQFYYYVAYTIEGLQGFIVAMLYCYVNKEVHALIKATYRKTETAVISRIRRDSSPNNVSSIQSDRRLTATTGVPSHQEDNKEQYATIKPRLHVAEIISIQASEKLAEMLEPVYETIQNAVNERYDSLDRSDNDSGFIPRDGKTDDSYYAFTNASSVSIDCQDWIRCVSSPSSSVYNNSLNDYETKYIERKFANHPKLKNIRESREKKSNNDNNSDFDERPKVDRRITEVEDTSEIGDVIDPRDSQMLEEIMQYIDNNDDVDLDPDLLSPNRRTEDKIVFVKE